MRLRFFAFSLFLVVLSSAISIDANAQFWKKSSDKKNEKTSGETQENVQPWHHEESKRELKRKQREQEKQERKNRKKEKREQKLASKKIAKELKSNSTRGGKKKASNTVKAVRYPPTVKKSRYRVDVLAPIYLDELVKGGNVTFKEKIPEKAVAGLNFYEGIMFAADSLKNGNYDIDIYIHDVSSKHDCIDSLIKYKKLDSSDLVIGAVVPQDLPALSAYTAKKHINFVSALSPAYGGVQGNKFFTIIQPTLKTHCEYLAGKIEKDHSNSNVAILYRNSITAEENAYKYINADSTHHQQWKKLLCNTLPTKKELSGCIDTTNGAQVIIMAVLDNLYADSLLKVLTRSYPNTRFEVFGMPSWTGLGLQRRSTVYSKTEFNITVPFNYNYTSVSAKYVELQYNDLIGGKPPELVYRGFETLIWYGNLLRKYGTMFNEKYNDTRTAPFTKFDIVPQWDKKGKLLYNENKRIYLLKYSVGNVTVVE